MRDFTTEWQYRHIPASLPTQQLLILLHGYGASGDDLIDLAPFFQSRFPHLAINAPHAPEPCTMNAGGRQWFDLIGYNPQKPDLARLRNAAEYQTSRLCRYITDLAQHQNVALDKVALLGFSQGTMMALNAALRLEQSVATVIGFSGALLHAVPPKCAPFPILLLHGNDDTVVPAYASSLAEQTLKKWRMPVSLHTYAGLGHGINEEGIQAATDFLSDCFH